MVHVSEIDKENLANAPDPDQVNKGSVSLPNIRKSDDADDARDKYTERKNCVYGITPVH